MLSMRDHAVEQEIRKDAQAQAEHHRMLKLACTGRNPHGWRQLISACWRVWASDWCPGAASYKHGLRRYPRGGPGPTSVSSQIGNE